MTAEAQKEHKGLIEFKRMFNVHKPDIIPSLCIIFSVSSLTIVGIDGHHCHNIFHLFVHCHSMVNFFVFIKCCKISTASFKIVFLHGSFFVGIS